MWFTKRVPGLRPKTTRTVSLSIRNHELDECRDCSHAPDVLQLDARILAWDLASVVSSLRAGLLHIQSGIVPHFLSCRTV